jgi:hypothetical protein
LTELRENVFLPPDVDLSEGASADLVRRVASHLAPGLEGSVGPVRWTAGEANGVDWTAEGVLDGGLVVVCLRPSSRELSLLVDPRFAPLPGPVAATIPILLGLSGMSVALGLMRRSVWWAVLSFIGAVATWIGADAVRHERTRRRAIASLDRAGWSRRFQEAVALASRAR